MVTFDTSAFVAAVDRRDPDHERVVRAMREDTGPFVLPISILVEISYFLERRYGARLLNAFIDDLLANRYLLDCGEENLPRIQQLVRRYDDLPLGFADAAVIACAERYGGKVLTLDLRHFGVVAREGTITLLP